MHLQRARRLVALVTCSAAVFAAIFYVAGASAADPTSVSVGSGVVGSLSTQISTNNVYAGMVDQFAVGVANFRALGLPLVRLHVGDDSGAPAMPEIRQGQWSFKNLDVLVNDVTSSGQRPLMNIKFAPDWMWTCSSFGQQGHVADLTFQTFADYMARLVAYYNTGSMTTESGAVIVNPAGTSNRIDYWELWNEPDLSNETPCAPASGQALTPSEYVTMWNAVVPKMLAVDPSLRFVGPATAGAQFGSSSGVDYIPKLLAGANVKPYAISFHGYGYWDNAVSDKVIFDGDSTGSGGIADFVSNASTVHASYPSYPIWITEMNVNAAWSNDPHGRPWGPYGAAWWGSAYVQLSPVGVALLHQYNVSEAPQFGLISDQDGTPYLPYWTLKTLNAAFPGNSQRLQTSSPDSSIQLLAARRPDGKISVLVVNRRVDAANPSGGVGLPADLNVSLNGITAQALTLTQIDSSTNAKTGPATATLDASQPISLHFPGYGLAVLTITPSGTTAPAPTVSSFSPSSGPAGTVVTLTGSGFSGATAVKLGSTSAAYTVASDSQISATVPSGASSGAWSVTTANGTGTSSSTFTVTTPPPPSAPVVSSFTPTSGPVGTAVTLSGSGFTGATAVKIGGSSTAFTVVSDGQISTSVPNAAASGTWSVTTPAGTGTSSSSFTVTTTPPPSAPAVSSFNPTSGSVGASVTLTGSGFTGATAVKIGGSSTAFTVVSDGQISTSVPSGASSGTWSVTTPAGTGSSSSAFTVTTSTPPPSGSAATPMPLISRGVPAFASSNLYPAKNANDADYSTTWRGAIPSWLAYDLSGVPASQRHQVVVGWFNDPITTPYDHVLIGDNAYNNLRDYTIDANAAPGGGSPPTSGWVTLATVTGNHYHSRQHLIDLTGYNWIRINVTASDGSSGNSDAAINLDVHDASQGLGDDWMLYGDSITQDGLHHQSINGTGNFSQLITAAKPGFTPLFEDGGIGGLLSSDGAQNIGTWLAVFPGRYVALNYGTNDANSCVSATTFYNNYVTMVKAVLAAGKIPVVPTIPWARSSNVQSCAPALNAKIQALYTAYPQIVKGPDLWTYFQQNQSLISGDNLHPSAAGYVALRQQWANAMVNAVYSGGGGGGTPAPAVSLSPGSLSFSSQTVGTTSGAKTTTLANSGSASLSIASIAASGDFAETNTCPTSLAAGASCTISVTFSPSASGTRSGAVSVASNAASSPDSVSLTGTGVRPVPQNTVAPAISGTPQVGQTLTASQGTWTNSPTSYSYRWNRCDTSGANCTALADGSGQPVAASTYSPTSADVGSTIEVGVDATNSGGTSQRVWSAPTAAVTNVPPTPPVVATAPAITGTPQVGSVLSVSNGTWTGTNPMTFTYGWDRCDVAGLVCLPIVGATSNSYTVSTPDAGSTLRADVTATNAAGSATASSQPTAVVTAPLPVTPPPVGAPTLDAMLGSGKTNTSTMTMKLKTTAPAARGSRIVLFLSWAHRTRSLASVAGGGLTWSVDVQASDGSDNNNHGAIASAYAPDGLPAGTVITATFSAAVVHGLVAAVSFTGIDSSDPVVTTASTVQAGVGAWNATIPSATSGDLVVGWTNLDAVTADTANPSLSEVVDMSDPDYWGSATAVYTVSHADGPATVSGMWAQAGGSTGNVTVAVAYRPGS